MEFNQILEIIILSAISIELYALYNHTKLDTRIDDHILEANESFAASNAIIKTLDEHMLRFDEHIFRFDEHMNEINNNLSKVQEQMVRLDDHIHALLDEYVSSAQRSQAS